MKKIILSAFVFAMTIGAAQAQSTSTEREKGHRKEHRMGGHKDLNLTEDQKARFKALHEEQRKEMEAIRNNTSLTKEQQKEKRKALHDSYGSKMQSLLTPDQKAKFEAAKDQSKGDKAGKKGIFKRGEGRKHGGDSTGNRGAFGRRGDIEKSLNLSADQKERMAKIRSDYKSRFETLRSDKSLTGEAKKAKFSELKKAQLEASKSVLTQEQIDQLKSQRKDRPERNTRK